MHTDDTNFLPLVAHLEGDFSACATHKECIIVATESTLLFLDSSIADSISEISLLKLEGNVQDVRYYEGFLYAVDFNEESEYGSVYLINIDDIRNPFVIYSYKMIIKATQIVVMGNMIYVTDSWSGLCIFSVLGREKIEIIGEYSIEEGGWGVYVQDDLAYIAAGSSGLHIVNINEPGNLITISHYDEIEPVYGVVTHGDNVYLAAGKKGLQILNISTPKKPKLIGEYTPLRINTGHLAVVGTIAFVAGCPDIDIIDISNPTEIRKLGSYSAGIFGAVLQDKTVLIMRSAGIDFIDGSHIL